MAQLFPAPLDAILAAIKAQNGVDLVRAQYLFSNPIAVANPNGNNTEITVTANSPESPYTGSVTVNYRRLDLANLATLLPLPLKFSGITTVAQAATALNAMFGLNFVMADDLVAGDLNVAVDGSGTLTLTAKANSLGWIGTVDLPFVLGNLPLATIITQPSLPGLLYPNRDVSKPFGEMYSYWRDFTAQSTALAGITTSAPDLAALAALLQQNTTHAWTAAASGRYSVKDAVVTYNGDTAGRTDCNTAYLKVCIVTLDPTASLGYSGQLFLHYTPPGSDGIDP